MNRHPNKAKKSRKNIRPWTHDRARAALPYLRSILQSLRQHQLEAQTHDLRARRLAERPGRPDRNALLARQDALDEARRAQERFDEALAELSRLDVFCVDPINGLAFVPFVQQEQLAWFVLDL